MRVIVNHLTRMRPGYICVAAIDTATGQHVRPVTAGHMTTRLLTRYRGLFDMAATIDLGRVVAVGKPPETEDQHFDPSRARRCKPMEADAFWQLLSDTARTSLTAIFGDDLVQRGHSCTVEIGQGRASLGCLRLAAPPDLWLDVNNRIRVRLDDGTFAVNLGLTDLRFYEPNHLSPRPDVLEDVVQRIAAGVPALLSVGLSRPWPKPGDGAARHWLQVNNIHLQDDPCWQDCSL